MEAFVNSLSQTMVPLAPGEFDMGSDRGDYDERPTHTVHLSHGFYLASTPVTNAQFEVFDPAHRKLRGKQGLSYDDDDAVIFVTWHQAMDYCAWLAEREGRAYRLPTEAEWEYACRAGTYTPYWCGPELLGELAREQVFDWYPKPCSLRVGQGPANPWGLLDMHGLVEEWCLDGYGPYSAEDQVDPLGPPGELRITRGGSHNSEPRYLRSANRGAELPSAAHALLGFRLALGELPAACPTPAAPPAGPRWAQAVAEAPAAWPPPSAEPLWLQPRRFVRIAPDADGPLYAQHNHCPAVCWCPNGDLLAAWFSCRTERGREMTIAAARLRWGANEWDPADVFLEIADRNLTGTALWHDQHGRLLHLNGKAPGHGWAQLAIVQRTSLDQGRTWSIELLAPEHGQHHQVIAGVTRLRSGRLTFCCDATWAGEGGTVVHLSDDNGESWYEPAAGASPPRFSSGARGPWIAGIHAALVELADGSLLAYGRGDAIDGHLAASRSTDEGRSWTYSASPWPPIGGGQRLVLTRLAEGPLLLCSFTDASHLKEKVGLPVLDAAGRERRIFGLFAALSYDDGESWPVVRPITAGAGCPALDGGGWTGPFVPDNTHSEPAGYLASTQTPDGVIHLLSSAVHYGFNLAWLEQPLPAD